MKTYLIIEKNDKELHVEVVAKSKYDALKQFQSEWMKMYFKGNIPYLSNVCSGLGSREYVALLK